MNILFISLQQIRIHLHTNYSMWFLPTLLHFQRNRLSPSIQLETVPIGAVFVIHGTTNLPASTNKSLLLSITPTWKDPDRYSGFVYSKYLTIIQGENKTNHWSENVTEADWRLNNEYFVKISSLYVQDSPRINTPVATQVFTIFPANTSPTLIYSSPSPIQSPSIQNPSLVLPTTDKVTLTPSTRAAQLPASLPIAIMVDYRDFEFH